jgi:5-methylcytosine-specific restriction endonuclease McrA
MANRKKQYDSLDWTKSNHELALQLSVSARSIRLARKRRGMPKAKLHEGSGDPSPKNKDLLWTLSPATKPVDDLDYEFAKKDTKHGRGGGQSWHKAVVRLFGPNCKICGYYKPSVTNPCHHIVPLSQGGKNTIRNGVVLCVRCHSEVHAGLINLCNLNCEEDYAI